MQLIELSALDLALASLLILGLALLSWRQGLALERSLLIAALRNVLQLLLIGYVLTLLFEAMSLPLISLMALVMLLAAGYEVRSRQRRRLRGLPGYAVGLSAMLVSSFSLTLLALFVLLNTDPWWQPQYLIPLLGMLLGNTMTGIALALDRLHDNLHNQREVIEQRLMLGETAAEARQDIVRDALRSGMIPMINAMAAAGLVSLPGMMTGQILAGSPPMDAVKYQILLFFLITAGTGIGVLLSIRLSVARLFDARERLRLDELST